MAEQPAGEHRGGSSDTEQGILIQQDQPATPNSRGISSPSSGKASLSLAATATGGKNPGYYSENGYLMELSRQERRRIQQEINKRFKPGEMKEIFNNIMPYSHGFKVTIPRDGTGQDTHGASRPFRLLIYGTCCNAWHTFSEG